MLGLSNSTFDLIFDYFIAVDWFLSRVGREEPKLAGDTNPHGSLFSGVLNIAVHCLLRDDFVDASNFRTVCTKLWSFGSSGSQERNNQQGNTAQNKQVENILCGFTSSVKPDLSTARNTFIT